MHIYNNNYLKSAICFYRHVLNKRKNKLIDNRNNRAIFPAIVCNNSFDKIVYVQYKYGLN
jgi:hypothetical protein